MKTVSKSASKPALLALFAAFLVAGPAMQAASLWSSSTGGGERSMFADHKASRTGDILTVVVAESAAAKSSQSKSAKRDSALQDAVKQFVFSVAASKLGTHAGELPGTNLTGKSTYSGGGEVANSQTLDSRAAVLVTDVLPNGNLVIEGVRVVTFSGETQYVVLHGLVRGDDISSGNTVLSTNIADARVEFLDKGSISDAQKRGWLSKVYEKLRPF